MKLLRKGIITLGVVVLSVAVMTGCNKNKKTTEKTTVKTTENKVTTEPLVINHLEVAENVLHHDLKNCSVGDEIFGSLCTDFYDSVTEEKIGIEIYYANRRGRVSRIKNPSLAVDMYFAIAKDDTATEFYDEEMVNFSDTLTAFYFKYAYEYEIENVSRKFKIIYEESASGLRGEVIFNYTGYLPDLKAKFPETLTNLGLPLYNDDKAIYWFAEGIDREKAHELRIYNSTIGLGKTYIQTLVDNGFTVESEEEGYNRVNLYKTIDETKDLIVIVDYGRDVNVVQVGYEYKD